MKDEFQRILIIAAHPDDEVLGSGGLIHKSSNLGSAIRIVFMAEGNSSRFTEINALNKKQLEKLINVRERCALESLTFLGVDPKEIYFSRRKCCQLDTYPRLHLTKEIEKHIKEFQPSCLITHYEKDTNIDHQVCYNSILPAIRPVNNPIRLVLSFEILSSTEWNYCQQFRPNYFINIKDNIKAKIHACSKYQGEISEKGIGRSAEMIRALSILRGSQSGYDFAEAYKLIVSR